MGGNKWMGNSRGGGEVKEEEEEKANEHVRWWVYDSEEEQVTLKRLVKLGSTILFLHVFMSGAWY